MNKNVDLFFNASVANRLSSSRVECHLKVISNKQRIPRIRQNHRRSFSPCFVVKQRTCFTWTIRLSISKWYHSRLISLVCAMCSLSRKHAFVLFRSSWSISGCCSFGERSRGHRPKEWQVELCVPITPRWSSLLSLVILSSKVYIRSISTNHRSPIVIISQNQTWTFIKICSVYTRSKPPNEPTVNKWVSARLLRTTLNLSICPFKENPISGGRSGTTIFGYNELILTG